jgi:hypothetical protein
MSARLFTFRKNRDDRLTLGRSLASLLADIGGFPKSSFSLAAIVNVVLSETAGAGDGLILPPKEGEPA